LWVDSKARVGERCVIVAHNLAYDLRIADAFRWLPELGWRLDRIRLDAEQTQCRWRDGKRTLLMIDSTSWFPGALDPIGDEVHIEKPALPSQADSDALWVDRCTTDVRILREAYKRVLRWLSVDDLGNWQPTGAGQAWATWRHRFMDCRVLVGDDPEVRDMEREAVWCGRAEAWRHGEHRKGPFTEWDMQCAYLRIMRECALPIRQVHRASVPDGRLMETWRRQGRVLARIEVTTDVPVVPAQGPHGIYWPVGTFQTTVWDPELQLLDEAGATYKVLDAAVYQRRDALAAFANWLWPLATNDAHNVDPIVHRVAKHWSRALIGRFGVRYRTWEPYGDTPTYHVGLQTVSDLTEGTTWRLLSIGNTCLREGDTVEGENAIPSLMGWVMSETRRRLWLTMARAGLDHVLHVDTDGLLVDPIGSANLEQHGYAGLRVKGVYSRVDVLAPRQVVYGGQLRAPGVPRRSKRIERTTWEGESWQWLTTALQTGRPDRVIVAKRRITLSCDDPRRQHLRGGATAPYTMEGE
jgi:hypothetical protein